ncbi:(-)-germacrene D synthase [Heracleum sosnowskyi]|uniref:(-)-germacrene D synthase n=1 Tax=Heracleum sosnowskyi TaxID=360622 RepID=A0AAD8H020_9APIA|nr:(-)-germacrene D synthase [Heracleum sosnowskyi]
MALYVQSTSGPPPNVVPEITRKSASFHPSVWGDKFLAYDNSNEAKSVDDQKEEEHLKLLKQEAKKMLTAGDKTRKELISLVDDIQRLGLSYHFEAEFDKLLQKINDSFHEYYGSKNDDDLHDISLCFRLLRQQGYNVSSAVFYKFKDSNGKFKQNLVKDVRGMLSLFEATHLRVHGENILEDALEFTTTHLHLYLNSDIDNPLIDLVGRSLKYPLRKSLNRLVARHYITIYHKLDWHNQLLLDFAKCDFNLVQKLHQVELGQITRWWKDLDFANKLPFARDRVVECYFWITGVYFEPYYAKARAFVTKVITLTSVVDDIYDAYGIVEELEQFTDAIGKWDIRTIDQLPEYMRHCYQPLLDVFAQAEEESVKEGRPIHGFGYAKEAFKRLTRAYFHEAKWCQVQYFPTLEEYMSITLVTAGYKMLSVTSFVLMGNVATREAFDWISKEPLIERAASVINRLHDDIVGHEFEMQRPNIPTSVDIFMKQYGVSKETTYDALQKRVINAWKDINQECLHPAAVPMPLLTRVINFACVINLLYDGDDGYTHSSARTKDMITSTLLDPVPV